MGTTCRAPASSAGASLPARLARSVTDALHGGQVTTVLNRWPTASEQAPATGAWSSTSKGLLTGALAGAGAATAGLAIIAAAIGLIWITDPATGGSILGPAQLSVQAWLLGHGADVSAAGTVVAITPLGLTALLGVCCWYAACWAGQRGEVNSLAEIGKVAAGLVSSYTVIGIGLTLLGSNAGAEIGIASSTPGVLALSTLAGVGGLLRTAGHGRALHDITPFPSRAIGAGIGMGAAALGAAGIAMVGIAIAVDRAGFAALTEVVAPGWSAGLGLLLLSLLLLPNAALYAVSVLLGPGFAVGSGTAVSALDVTLGRVPALPLAAALPDRPAVPLGLLVSLVVPTLCGIAVGAAVTRRLDEQVSRLTAAGWAAVAGLLLSAALGLAQWLAGGSLGAGGLALIGASPMASGAAAAVALVLPAALSAGLARGWHPRRS